MDDKKKIIFLSIAVVVAVGLIVLIVLTRRGNEGGMATLPLPAVPTTAFPIGTPTGTSTGGTGGVGGAGGWGGGAGQPGNAAAASGTTTLNAFVYGSAGAPSAGRTGNYNPYLHAAPVSEQPQAGTPTISISKGDIVAEVTKELRGQIQSAPGAQVLGLNTDAAISKYVSDLMDISTNQAKLQSLLDALGSMGGVSGVANISPQALAEQLANATSDAAVAAVVNSLSNMQGLTSGQVAYLQSLSTVTSTSALNQNLITLGVQNQDFISNVIANASGPISGDQLQQLVQQFNASSGAECAQISQQMAGLNNLAQQAGSAGASDIFGLNTIVQQYLPMQSCGFAGQG